jgi:glycosyltransferase involved in cell wall biosynthesis
LRVAQLSPSIYPVLGGVESYLVTLSLSLRSFDVSSEIVALCDTKKWNGTSQLKEKRLKGTRVLVWPSYPIGVLNMATSRVFGTHFAPGDISDLERHLRDFDLLHFHDEVDLSFPISLRRMKKGKLLTFHTSIDALLPFFHANPMARRLLTKSASLFHVFSKIDKSSIVELGVGAENVRIVPHGVDIHDFRPRSGELEGRSVRIACICRIERRKGLIDLLAAARILKTQLAQGSFNIQIVGPVADNKYYHELLEYKERMHLEEVTFVGALAPDSRRITSFLQQSSIFTLPSLREAFGRVNLEAMACGLPVVATKVGAVPEVVVDSETGFLIPPNDPKNLAEKLAILIDDKELRKEMGRKGRKRIELLFSVEQTTPMMIDIYKELA